jgi:hypothetical protein
MRNYKEGFVGALMIILWFLAFIGIPIVGPYFLIDYLGWWTLLIIPPIVLGWVKLMSAIVSGKNDPYKEAYLWGFLIAILSWIFSLIVLLHRYLA